MSAKYRTVAMLAFAIALILCVLAFQLIFSPEKTLNETSGAVTIVFSTEKSMVAAPGACVNVRWQVDHIQSVYINDTAAVGEGQQVICVDETTMPVLHVVFEDNTQTDYRLEISFLIQQPSTWLLATAAVMLALAGIYVALTPAASGASPMRGHMPRFVSLFAGIGLVVTGVAITALVLELVLRFYFANFGSQPERIAYLYSREEIEQLNPYVIPLPEIDYGLSPNHPEHNHLGYRGAEIELPKPPGVFRIVAMGGSTTYGTASPPDETYPFYLQKVLREDYGYENVEVLNAGVLGYTTWQTFVNLALRITELEPDLVIIYDATNDVLPREVDPDCYSGINPLRGLDPRGRLSNPGWLDGLSPTVLYRFVAVNLGWIPNPATIDALFADSVMDCGVEHDDSTNAHNVEVNRPIYFERNLRNMIAIAQANGFQIMFASWAYETPNPEAQQFWRAAVAEHNQITAQVAQEAGVLYLNYAAVAPTDHSYWSDYIHMNGKGNLHQAQAFAQFLVDQDVIPTP